VRLLVTGGAGFIGSVVAERAVAGGHAVTVLDTLQNGVREAVPDGSMFVLGDCGDRTLLDRLLARERYDAVVHLAAEAAIAESVTDPAKYFDANLVKGLVLLDAMRRHQVGRIVVSSTAAVYGEPTSVPLTEDHPHRPINAYGESKLMFERCLAWYHRAYALTAIAFRYFNAGGASHDRGEARATETHLIPLALDVAAGKRPVLAVYGLDYPTRDGSCVRDYVHVLDIADAHLVALDAIDRVGFDCFNIGSGQGHSVLEVIAAVERVTGRAVATEIRPRRPGDPAALVASADRIRAVLDWSPREPSIDAIVGSAWAWRERYPHGYEHVSA
jgi:UDP-glucose 4-epimerase